MAIMANWCGQTWEISSHKILVIDDLSTGKEIQMDSEDGVQKVTGIEPQKVSISSNLYRAAGIDIQKAIDKWYALVNKNSALYIGKRRFGPPTLKLQSVSLSDITLRADGEILSCTLELSFIEWDTKSTAKKDKSI